jgi:hypothetical protein
MIVFKGISPTIDEHMKMSMKRIREVSNSKNKETKSFG